MNTWAVVGMLSLAVVMGLSLVGLVHRGFKDNLLQCLGLCGLLIFGASRFNRIWHAGDVDDPSVALLYLALAIYGLGTAIKVTLHLGREKGWGFVINFDRAVAERKTASGALDSKPHHHV